MNKWYIVEYATDIKVIATLLFIPSECGHALQFIVQWVDRLMSGSIFCSPTSFNDALLTAYIV
jgi:hypothetical protein